MDLNKARLNMVQQQVRTWDVLDEAILNLMLQVPREEFVPLSLQTLAYSDTFLPIGHNQVMLPPKVVGRMLQALKIKPTETVLEIGTGTGYVTALLSMMAKKVISVEIIPELSDKASEILTTQNHRNVDCIKEDGVLGLPAYAPYDVIVITGSMPYLPKSFHEQLKMGGRLAAFVGDSPAMSALLQTHVGKGNFVDEVLFETVVPALINAPQPDRFEF